MLTLAALFMASPLLLLHLDTAGSFPKPLTAKQERETLARYFAGDMQARAELIEHNLRLVAHVVRKYTVPGYSSDDLVSVGTLGLIKAVNTYRVGSATPLSSYAARCIENEVLMLLRASKKRRGEVSLNEPIGMDGEGNDISFQDILGTPPDQVEDEAIRHVHMQQVRQALKTLPERERMVLEMRYGLRGEKPLMQHEAAEKLGISRSYISRIESRAIARIRDELMKK